MDAIAIGPLVFSAERLTAILAALTFLLLAELLARHVDARMSRWAFWAVVVFVIAARLGHVLDYLPAFRAEPWRVFAIWQGGFRIANGVIAAFVMTLIWFRRDRRLLRWTLLPAAGALAVSAALILRAPRLPPTALPTHSFPLLDGGSIVPASLKGQPVVVNLWATWCPPCRREMPMMAEIAAQDSGATFLFVNQGEDAERVGKYLTGEGLRIDNMLLDPQSLFGRHYSTLGMPVTLFIAPDGTLRALHVGEISRERLTEGIARISQPEGGDN